MEGLIDDLVVGKRDSLLVDLSISSLQNQFSDDFAWRVSKGDVWLNATEQVRGSLVDSDKDSVMDLSEPEQPQDSKDLRVELVDTSDSNDEGNSWMSRHVDLSCQFCASSCRSFLLVGCLVLGLIFLSLLEDKCSPCFIFSPFGSSEFDESLCNFGVSCFLLLESFRFRRNNFLSWHNHKQINIFDY